MREMKFGIGIGIGIGRKRTCQGRVWNGLKLIRQFLFSRVRENKYWTKTLSPNLPITIKKKHIGLTNY